jgi:hypothetical protein
MSGATSKSTLWRGDEDELSTFGVLPPCPRLRALGIGGHMKIAQVAP